jgi:ParB/RepB/Spo0J family partition protein
MLAGPAAHNFTLVVRPVPEPEFIATHPSQNSAARSEADDVVHRLGARELPEREGLPKSYRMRADAHYVDQLEAPAQPIVRKLSTRQIECRDLPAPDGVDTLTRSIARHGVLQPLLIQRHSGRYTLIAGRKRLAAAIAAGLGEVPCLLHECDSSEASALAAAENLRIVDASDESAAGKNQLRPVLQALAADLAAIRLSTSMLRSRRSTGLAQQVAPDLIESQISHAAWLASGLLGAFENTRQIAFGAIVQRAVDEFASYVKLTGLQLEPSITPAAAVCSLPEEAATAVLRGAIFATLSFLSGSASPRIEVHADVQSRFLKIEVVQRIARIPTNLESLTQEDDARPVVFAPALALLTARAVVEPHGGGAELTALPGLGSVFQITFGSGPARA